MPIFFHIWLLSFATLAVAVVLLTLGYRLLGSDLGTDGFVRETVIALVASACQALVIWAVVALIGAPAFFHFVFAAVVAGLIYIATHLEDMGRLEASLIGATQFALYLAAVLVLSLGP